MRDGLATDGWFKRGCMRLAEFADHRYGWDRLPKPIAMLTLLGLRMVLRRENLFDPFGQKVSWGPEFPPVGPRSLVRSADGSGTDPCHPEMGMAGMPFGRNVPPSEFVAKDVLEPNPRTVSTELLARDTFKPATTLNLLAAAWIQFEVHDWMSHGTNEPMADNPWEIPLEADDPWPERPMKMRRTRGKRLDAIGAPVFDNTETHWWDASQVYGSSQALQDLIRVKEGGLVKVNAKGMIPFDPPTITRVGNEDVGGITGNWWLGLAMMHSLFMCEHNAICHHLAACYRNWNDQEIFDHARLVNAALIAKIHTTEWTPALLNDSVMRTGMRVNWWGFQGESLSNRLGRLTKSEEISGIPGSNLYHHGAPYAMTEEFVAVYRMHPLIPDTYSLRTPINNQLIEELTFEEVAGLQTHGVLEDERITLDNLFYSFGTSNPGAIALHNFPQGLRRFKEPDGTLLDLAAADILRDRERGVPRYNEFRRRFHMKPAERFEDFSDDPAIVEQIRRIYADPEDVDLMIGLYAEKLPEGFAFSDTAFRVFVLMASRRLKSDRFFTYDYRPEVYTKEGMRWVENNTMTSVLLRHFPSLEPALHGLDNAFKPWRAAGAV